MANTGHLWGAWAFVQESGDWDARNLANGASTPSDAITGMDQKTACILGFKFLEDNTGAISGDMVIKILGDVNGTNYEDFDMGNPFGVSVTPVQNDIVYYTLPIDVTAYNDFKVSLTNNSGQIITCSIWIKFADMPAPS